MNRIIKFRTWDRKTKEMIYDALEIGNIGLGDGSVVVDEKAQRGNELDWMQFTGLKDKNGKEIYCSDFVGVSKEKYGEVYWNEDELAWWIESIGEYPIDNEPLRDKGNAIEILGNKFEGLA